MKKITIVIILIAVALLLFFALRPAPQDNEESARNYVGSSPEECALVQVTCVEGFQRFDDESGCGCEVVE